MKQPSSSSSTTTTTEMWQWQCGTCRADWKVLRQVTITCCPHGDGCCPHGGGGGWFQGQGTPPPPSARNPAPRCHHHHHHHRHRQEEVTSPLQGTSSRALAAGAEGSNTDAGRHATITAVNHPARPAVVAEVCWVPDPYLMVQQLREFESLNNDELVALRVQLQEYAQEIHKSSKEDINARTGMNMNWLLALPADVRDVVILARDVIESFITISTTSATATASPPPAN